MAMSTNKKETKANVEEPVVQTDDFEETKEILDPPAEADQKDLPAEPEKVSFWTKVKNSKPAEIVKKNWKPFAAGAGTAVAVGFGVLFALANGGDDDKSEDIIDTEAEIDDCPEGD